MAIKQFYLGTCGPYLIDDAHALYADPTQVATKQDVADGITVLADTVEAETSFGTSPSAGTSDDVSRSDHTHGTPANPLAGGLSGTYNFDATTSGKITSMTFTNGILTSVTTKP